MKKLALLAVLALAFLSLANAKGYSIILAHSSKAGSAQLKAGEYGLQINGSNAVFTSKQTSKSISVPIKVENGTTKFSQTVVETTTVSGSDVIQDIELGGSSTKVEFSN
jgi:hypothetical protein